jgi:uncharacterized membrane protein HdeD (DUF308 family)
MYSTIAQGSSTLVIRGIVALIFGAVALLLPVTAFWVLVIAFGAYAFADGISALITASTRRNRDGRGWLAVEGLAGMIAGVITFFSPASTAVALIALVSAWALVTGFLKIVLAIRLRREIRGEWLLALSGVASILLAVLIIATPVAATIALIWALGIYALVMGGLMIALSVRIRHWERTLIHGLESAA